MKRDQKIDQFFGIFYFLNENWKGVRFSLEKLLVSRKDSNFILIFCGPGRY
jgi:hypothetical protein